MLRKNMRGVNRLSYALTIKPMLGQSAHLFFSTASKGHLRTRNEEELEKTTSVIKHYLEIENAKLLTAQDNLHILVLPKNKKNYIELFHAAKISATYNPSTGTMSLFEDLAGIREKIGKVRMETHTMKNYLGY